MIQLGSISNWPNRDKPIGQDDEFYRGCIVVVLLDFLDWTLTEYSQRAERQKASENIQVQWVS